VESHLLSLIRRSDPEKYRFVLIAPLTSRFEEKCVSHGVRIIQHDSWQAFHPLTYQQISVLCKKKASP